MSQKRVVCAMMLNETKSS